jgi:hypothetical protein
VITDDEVWRLFEQADTAGDSAPRMLDAAGYLDALTLRSHDMTLIDTTETPTTPPGGNRWTGIGLAAAATVLVVAAGVYLTRSDDAVPSVQPTTVQPTTVQPTTVQSPSPTTVADGIAENSIIDDSRADDATAIDPADSALALVRAYYAAIDAYDADLARSYTEGVPNMDDLSSTLELDKQIGFSAELGECAATARRDSTVLVRCWLAFEGLGSTEMGFEPFVGNSTELVVDNGKIVNIAEDFNWAASGFYNQVFLPMADWVAATHPADMPVMYGFEDGQPVSFNTTAESAPLWEQRTREYVELRRQVERTASGFMQAFGALDADAAGVYVAADADTAELLHEDVQNFQEAIELYAAMGYRQRLDSCRDVHGSTALFAVRCELAYELMGSGDVGFDAFDGSFVTITVDEQTGLITEAVGSWASAEFLRDVGDPFATWLHQRHPDDVALMSENGSPRLTPESFALWRQRRIEYVQSVLSTPPPATTD